MNVHALPISRMQQSQYIAEHASASFPLPYLYCTILLLLLEAFTVPQEQAVVHPSHTACSSYHLHSRTTAAAASRAGVYRASGAGGNAPLSYSTVESDPISNNPDRRTEVVKPRARSAQDLYNLTPRPINLASGAPQIPVLVTNGAAVSQT
jgi:hypothetical protein